MSIAQMFRGTLMTPLWLAQLATGSKSFVDNPILGSERLNKVGLHTVRVRFAHAMAGFRRHQLAHLVRAQDRTDFARDGFIRRADFMPAELHKAVYAEVTSVAAEGREQVQGDTVPRRSPLDPETLKRMQAMRQPLAMLDWKNLLRCVPSFNCEPIPTVQTNLSLVSDAPPDPQTNFQNDN
ncbi:phytanoyl-CoA dioxygenase, partial [Methylobacterium sp. J-030]|nr:phytanoyl-CoA dioxygenase [Methylobacterium sp. J-030]